MASLLVWQLWTLDDRCLEQVELDDDGRVSKWIVEPGDSAAPEVGWWQGSVEQSVVDAATPVAKGDWPVETISPAPPGGAWWVSGPGGQMPLWWSEEDPAAEVRSQLAALGEVAGEAATEAVTAVRFSALWSAVGDERHPVVAVESVGSQQANLTLETDAGAEAAAFVTESAEVVGYFGGELWLPSGAQATALVRHEEVSEGYLRLGGTLATVEDEALEVAVTLFVDDSPS